MNELIRKLIFFTLMQVIYYNVLYILFIPEIYTIVPYIIALIIYYIISLTDTILRPLEEEGHSTGVDKLTIILLLLFLSNPLFLIAAVAERKAFIEPFFPFWNTDLISAIGIIIFILSGIIMAIGRLQLGKFATGKLSIQQDHVLIDTGLYKYIRHPIYTTGIVGGFFYFMCFNSLLMGIFYTAFVLLIFTQRANYEEKILEEEFGEEYTIYKQKTKKFFPFLY